MTSHVMTWHDVACIVYSFGRTCCAVHSFVGIHAVPACLYCRHWRLQIPTWSYRNKRLVFCVLEFICPSLLTLCLSTPPPTSPLLLLLVFSYHHAHVDIGFCSSAQTEGCSQQKQKCPIWQREEGAALPLHRMLHHTRCAVLCLTWLFPWPFYILCPWLYDEDAIPIHRQRNWEKNLTNAKADKNANVCFEDLLSPESRNARACISQEITMPRPFTLEPPFPLPAPPLLPWKK